MLNIHNYFIWFCRRLKSKNLPHLHHIKLHYKMLIQPFIRLYVQQGNNAFVWVSLESVKAIIEVKLFSQNVNCQFSWTFMKLMGKSLWAYSHREGFSSKCPQVPIMLPKCYAEVFRIRIHHYIHLCKWHSIQTWNKLSPLCGQVSCCWFRPSRWLDLQCHITKVKFF